eukprot:gb/GECG01007268.1/.p1 GENE.gb/GECG01007268.1/~~gb/GECG01007268.1/.p1  ORF type:complete len:686 (+),score=163.04 gb/GECG01007268.1/:1-2058(+)
MSIMEEADEILLSTLREADCKVPKQLKSIEDVDARAMLRITSSALNIVDGLSASKSDDQDQEDDTEEGSSRNRRSTVGKKSAEASGGQWPEGLPVNVAQRHRVCTSVANKVKELGFRGEFGYSQLLYPSSKDVRRFFQWLVEVLPRKSQKSKAKDTSPAALLQREIADAVGRWTKQQWHPPRSSRASEQRRKYKHVQQLSMPVNLEDHPNLTQEQRKYQTEYLLPLLQQINDPQTIARLLLSREAQASDQVVPGEQMKKEAQLSRRVRAAISKEAMQRPQEGSLQHLYGEDLAVVEEYFQGRRNGGSSTGLTSSNFQRNVHYNKEDIEVNPDVLAAARGEVSHTQASKSTQENVKEDAEVSQQQQHTSSDAGKESSNKEKTQEEIEEETVQKLENDLESANKRINSIQQEVANMGESINQVQQTLGAEQLRSVELENEYNYSAKAAKALPSADSKIQELQTSCYDMANSIVEAAAQFEQQRRPLLEKLRQLKRSDSEKQDKKSQLEMETSKLSNEMRDMTKEMQEREEIVSQLKKETESLSEEKSRVFYTQRILDMIGETHKQSAEIMQIVGDIRKLQEETSKIEDKLGRTSRNAENLIYGAVERNKNTDQQEYLEVYRQFSQIRESFRTIISLVQQGADNENEQRDYESQIQQLEEKNLEENTEKVSKDLERIQEEIKKLEGSS